MNKTKLQHRVLQRTGTIIFLLALFYSCMLPENETIAFIEVPDLFLNKWTTGMRCSNTDFDEVEFSFKLKNATEFTANSKTTDYDGNKLSAKFMATYDVATDSIVGQIEITRTEEKTLVRIDEFAFHLGSYNGELLHMQKLENEPGMNYCTYQIHFSFEGVYYTDNPNN